MSEYRIEEIKDTGGKTVRWEIYHEDTLVRSFTDQTEAERTLADLRSKEQFPST